MYQPSYAASQYSYTSKLPFADVVALVKEQLRTEGFEVLTSIDLQATMKTTLDVDYTPYLILGVWHPSLVHRAIVIEPTAGPLLPFNVVVHEVAHGVQVEFMNPDGMLGNVHNHATMAITTELRTLLQRILVHLAKAQYP